MSCPSCGADGRAGARHCARCGASLIPSCPHCGAASRTGDRFCSSCGGALAEGGPAGSEDATRQLAQGRYTTTRLLGEGSSKRVFLAHDRRLDRDVAIALIKTEGLDATGRVRVQREARAMGRLGDHANVVTIHDVAEEDGGALYLVAEYMRGGDLEAHLGALPSRRLPVADALRIAGEVCDALAHAHASGVIHRDVKPGNIWLDADRVAKLGDFGLAHAVDRTRLTGEGTLLGTAAYMSPEQALGRAPDARSDLYSLGASVYEMLTGRPPFTAQDSVGVISQHLNTKPVKPSWHNAEILRGVDEWVLRLLAKDPDERPESAAAARRELDALRASLEEAAQPHTPDESEAPPLGLSGEFVGRRAELAQLKGALESAFSGSSAVAMVVGEPGIGKTRLVSELSVYAKLRGARVLMGRCFEGETSLPYRPFIEALRAYTENESDESLAAHLEHGGAELIALLPELRERFPDLPGLPSLEGEAGRMRLFEAVVAFLRQIAAGEPIGIVLEDLHWADRPSLLLMRHVARQLGDARLLMVGTYRDVELERTHPLSDVIADLRREVPYERVLLRGLSSPEIRSLLEARSSQEPPEGFVHRIARETEGNPFFIEEVLRHLSEVGVIRREDGRWIGDPSLVEQSIPEGVREVIGRRLSRLSEGCNAMLQIASAMPAGFTFEVLRALSGEGEDAILDGLDEALAARVVAEQEDGARGVYQFQHALIRQTLYAEINTPRRVRLHRRIGEALEEIYAAHPDPHLAELAHHFFQAAPGGDLEKARGYATRAATRAAEMHAYEESAGLFDRALELCELEESVDESERLDLLLAKAQAQLRGGDREAGRKTSEQAIELARALSDGVRLAGAALVFAGEDQPASLEGREEIDYLREALEALGDADAELRGYVLTRLATSLTYDVAEAEPMTREALSYARNLGNPAIVARALYAQWLSFHGETIPASGEPSSFEVARIAKDLGDPVLWLSNQRHVVFDLMLLGRLSESFREVEEWARLADELRQPGQLWWAFSYRVNLEQLSGEFERARETLARAREVGESASHPMTDFVCEIQDTILTLQTRPVEASELPAFAEGLGMAGADRVQVVARARLLAMTGELSQARELLERIPAEQVADAPFTIMRYMLLPLAAEACALLGDRERAEVLWPRLRELDGMLGASVFASQGPIARHLGLLEQTLGRVAEAERHFEEAAQQAEASGARPSLAQVRFELASLLHERDAPGDAERVKALLQQSLELAESMGMQPLAEKALAFKLALQGADTSDPKGSIHAVHDSVQRARPDFGSLAASDGTVTLLFSDMESFTEMTQRLGDRSAHEVMREHNAIVRRELAAHDGAEVECQGDGFLLAFESPAQAMRCAMAIQRAFDERNRGGADVPLRVRIGAHTGQAIRDADRFFGLTVILTARIADRAEPGEILVSAELREIGARAGGFEFGDATEVALKGIAEPQRLQALRWSRG